MHQYRHAKDSLETAERIFEDLAINEDSFTAYVVVGPEQDGLWEFVTQNRDGEYFGGGYMLVYALAAADRGQAFDLVMFFEWQLLQAGYRLTHRGLEAPDHRLT